MRIFYQNESSDHFSQNDWAVKSAISQEKDDYILNVDEEEYISHLLSQFKIEKLEIKFDEISQTSSEGWVTPNRQGMFDYGLEDGGRYKKPVFTFHLPYEGNKKLLSCRPTSRSLVWSQEVEVDDQEIRFMVIARNDDPQTVKSELDRILENLRQQLEYLNTEINGYNARLETHIKEAFSQRKREISSKVNIASSLGIPLKVNANLPQTFAVPIAKIVRKLDIKPAVSVPNSPPVPTLPEGIYQFILEIIYESGQVIEKHPSLYKNKDEEGLRDYLLFQLQPRISGSATGETFNKSGKTDILIKHEGKNVFVSEVKFWSGKKGYLNAIDQLLGYLTWRDSKVALIIFVHNTDISSVLREIEEGTSSHPNFLSFIDKQDESWFNYKFHLTDDKGRDIRIAVLLFHIP